MPSAKSSIAISFLSGISIVLQIVSQLVIAFFFGTSRELEAYYVGLTLPAYALVVLTFSINTSFVPMYLKSLRDTPEGDGQSFGHTVLLWVTVLSIFISLCGIVFRHEVIDFLFRNPEQQLRELSSDLSLYLWPTVFLGSVFSLLSSRWQANARYVTPSIVQLLSPVAMVVITWILAPQLGVKAIALGNLIGSGAQFMIFVFLERMWLRGEWKWRTGEIGQWFRNIWILFSGNLVTRFSSVIERMAAATLPAGSIAELAYANRIIVAIANVVSSGIGVTGFTDLSNLASTNETERFSHHIRRLLRVTFLIVIPICTVIVFQGEWMVSTLFLRGKFSTVNVRNVDSILVCYTGYFAAVCIGTIIGRGLYALGLNVIATILDIIGVVYYGIIIIVVTPWLGVLGVALSLSLYFVLNTGIATFILFRRIGFKSTKREGEFVLKVVAAVIVMMLYYEFIGSQTGMMTNSIHMVVALGVFLSTLILLRLKELPELYRSLKTKA